MENNEILEQDVEKAETSKKAKYVNPVLAWGLVAAAAIIAGAIAAIVLMPLCK